MAVLEEKCENAAPQSQPHDFPSLSDQELSSSHVSCIPPYSDEIHAKTDCRFRLDAGLKAHLTTFMAFIALFFTFGQMNAFGTYQAWYSTHQLASRSASTISWIGSLQLWVFFFSGYPIGRLFDKYGPKHLMGIGTVCYLTSIMLTSVSKQYYQYLLTQGVLFGLGVGLLFYPSMASISTHYTKYRATALGIAAAGSSIGGVCYPITLRHLFERVGFGWGTRIVGFVGGTGCVLATVLTTRLPQPPREGPHYTVKTIKDVRFLFLTVGGGLVALGLFIPFFYIVQYAANMLPKNYPSFSLLAFMNAGGALGRVLPAIASDRVGRFNLLVPSAFLSGLFCITLWLGAAHSSIRIIAFCILYGFSSGSFISLITPCIAQISDPREIGTRIGLFYTVVSVPSLIGCPMAGVLLGRNHHIYTSLIIFSGCTTLGGSIFLMVSRLAIDRSLWARV